MAKIERQAQKIFAGNAQTDELAIFGSFKANNPIYTDNIEDLQSDAYEQGWEAAVIIGEAPFLEEMNGVQYGFSKQLAYMFQAGIPEWDGNTEYFENVSFCQVNGVVYQSLTDNNIGNSPITDNGTNWQIKRFMDIATDDEAASGELENVAINPKQLQADVTNLQSQIDAITSSSDVTDVVGTYAELQAYNTSGLTDKSIIKVLSDETQGGATTYYRWVVSGSSGSWQLIGQEGPYYTITQSNNTFVKKTDVATTTTTGTVKIGSGLNIATDGTVSVAQKNVTSLSTSGAVTLVDNSVYSITPTGAITFTLPTVTDTTKFHQILIQLNLTTIYSINLGTTYFFNSEAPDLSKAGQYDLIYEYNTAQGRWVVGTLTKGGV